MVTVLVSVIDEIDTTVFFFEPLFLSHQAYPVGNYPYPRNSNFETEGKPFRMKL